MGLDRPESDGARTPRDGPSLHAEPFEAATDQACALTLERFGLSADDVGLLIVDHGSRRRESNELLEEVTSLYRRLSGHGLVEAAHMELAEPTIDEAMDRLVRAGARLIVVHPYFLAPGRHWHADIPRLAAAAAARHPGVRYLVTAPLGLHPLMGQIITRRIGDCLQQALAEGDACETCAGGDPCRVHHVSGQNDD